MQSPSPASRRTSGRLKRPLDSSPGDGQEPMQELAQTQQSNEKSGRPLNYELQGASGGRSKSIAHNHSLTSLLFTYPGDSPAKLKPLASLPSDHLPNTQLLNESHDLDISSQGVEDILIATSTATGKRKLPSGFGASKATTSRAANHYALAYNGEDLMEGPSMMEGGGEAGAAHGLGPLMRGDRILLRPSGKPPRAALPLGLSRLGQAGSGIPASASLQAVGSTGGLSPPARLPPPPRNLGGGIRSQASPSQSEKEGMPQTFRLTGSMSPTSSRGGGSIRASPAAALGPKGDPEGGQPVVMFGRSHPSSTFTRGGVEKEGTPAQTVAEVRAARILAYCFEQSFKL